MGWAARTRDGFQRRRARIAKALDGVSDEKGLQRMVDEINRAERREMVRRPFRVTLAKPKAKVPKAL